MLNIAENHKFNLNSDDRPYLLTNVNGNKFKGLLDSGAQSSIMNEKTYEKMRKDGLKLEKCDIVIATCDGTTHDALGYVNVPFTVRNVKRTIPTLVVAQMEANLILGIDFWNAYRIKPCFTRNTYGISVMASNSIYASDPNDGTHCIETNFESDITPPKCLNVEEPHVLSREEQKKLEDVIKSFPFCPKEGLLNATHLKTAKIETKNAEPVRCKMRIEPPWKMKKIIEELDRLEGRGIIRKVESSTWLQPLMAVPKPNGKWRICLDARWLNAVTEKNCYPLQNANRILTLLSKAKYITTIDMTDAYFQIPLDPESQAKTAFAVPSKGTYVYNRMPMGLKNSGAELCNLIDSLFGYEFEPHVFPYLDDIVIVSETFEEHMEKLEKVANKFKYANLSISEEKSRFCYKRLKYLGHIIDENGVAMDKSRIEVVENLPRPKTVKDVQRLIGLTGWYRRFIKDFADITAPITELLKKGQKFVWSDECEKAFTKLITALTTAPVLATPDYKLPFEVQCDASNRACGAVLIQVQNGEERVIAYMSQKFTATQRKYQVTELECLAVILAIEKFRPYIEGTQFKVITDHHSLLWLKNLRDPNGRLARWALRLQAYDYTLVHRKGKNHIVPDALSRLIETVNIIDNNETKDEWYNRLKTLATEKPQENDHLKIVNGLVYIKKSMNEECHDPNCLWRLCVPKEKREQIMKKCHDDISSCHLGRFKTIHKIRQSYYWPAMAQTIEKYVRNCQVCKETKPLNQIVTPPAGKFVEAKRCWRIVATDIAGPYPMTKKGNRYLLVAYDIFSKFVIVKPVKNVTAKIITDFIRTNVVLRYACPEIILSDNGKQYRSVEFNEYAKKMGIKLWYTATYFAQANPTECENKIIGNAIRAVIYKDLDHRKWDEQIDEIANAINNSVHTGTKETPYEVNFGQRMAQHGSEYSEIIDINSAPKKDQSNLEKWRAKIQERLNEAREKYIKRYNLRTRKIDYKLGDIVYRKNTVLSDAGKYIAKKFLPKRRQCIIVGKTGTNTYTLKEIASGKLHECHAQNFCR